MTPILRRLAGLLGRTAERSAPGQDASDTPAAPAQGGGRRRGGRGRGGRGEGAAPARPDNRSNARGATGGGARQDARDARDARLNDRSASNGSTGYGNSSYDRRRPRRRDLDQPLPEDIAFRPPAEGGDRSILPSRRRPPPGLRATKRVLLAGRRFVPRGVGGRGSGGDEGDTTIDAVIDLPEAVTLPPEMSNTLPATTPAALPAALPGDTEMPAGEGERTGRRRRGRRGGRGRGGRGRGGDSAATSSDDA